MDWDSTTLKAYDGGTGQIVWQITGLPGVPGSYCVFDDDRALFGFSNGELRSIDASGSLSAPYHTEQGWPGVICAEGRYLVSVNNTLKCYRPGCERETLCTSKTNSLGCTATIGSTGWPSATGAGDFHVTASQVIGQTTGHLLWGPPGAIGASFLGPKLCVPGPRTIGPLAAAGTAGLCDGSFDVALDAAFFATQGLGAGSEVFAQFVYRDPAHPDGSGISYTDALRFTICP